MQTTRSTARRQGADGAGQRVGIVLMVELQGGRVAVPMPDGSEVLVDPRHHRPQVVRRLLCSGVSATTLRQLFPDWASLIAAAERELAGQDPPRQPVL